MKQNFLADIKFLCEEIIEKGCVGSGSEKSQEYRKETIDILQKVVNYIKSCTWSEVETAKFTAQYFKYGQNRLADAWRIMYPQRPPKADSTFRTQWQKMNQYLYSVFPSDMSNTFITEDYKKLQEISGLVDALITCDKGIGHDLGERLIKESQSLPLSSKKFSVEDCSHEITVLKCLSIQTYERLLNTCDKEKLAYVFSELLKPVSRDGSTNIEQLEFIKAYSKANTTAKTQNPLP